MKRPCAKCNKEIRWNGGSYHCSACRKNLPQPDTACLRCGGNAGGNLWCGDCSRPFTDSNKRLSQQLAYNKLDKRGRERSKNPGYSNGAIPLDL